MPVVETDQTETLRWIVRQTGAAAHRERQMAKRNQTLFLKIVEESRLSEMLLHRVLDNCSG